MPETTSEEGGGDKGKGEISEVGDRLRRPRPLDRLRRVASDGEMRLRVNELAPGARPGPIDDKLLFNKFSLHSSRVYVRRLD